jgi:hypothetical protein
MKLCVEIIVIICQLHVLIYGIQELRKLRKIERQLDILEERWYKIANN